MQHAQDEIVLATAVQHNFQLLAQLLKKKLPQSGVKAANTGYSQNDISLISESTTSGTNKSSIIKALRSRSLVTDPVNSLLKTGNIGLLEEVLRKHIVIPTKDEILGFLKNKMTRLVLMSLPKKEACKHATHSLLRRYDIICEVINLLLDPETLVDAIMIFKHIKRQDVEVMHLKQLKYLLLKFMNPDTEDECVPSHTHNPLMNFILMSNFMEEVKVFNSSFTSFFKEASNYFTNIAALMVKEIDDISHLRAVFAEKPYGADTLLDIVALAPDKYREVLNDTLMKQLVKEMWTGGLELELGFGDSSYVIASIISRKKNPFTTHSKKLKHKQPSYFQLQSWLYNCNVRHMFEVVGSLMIACFMVYIVTSYIYMQTKLSSVLNLTAEDSKRIQALSDKVNYGADNIILAFISLTTVHAVCITIYKKLTKPTLKLDPRMPLDLLIFVCIIQISPRLYGDYESGYNNSPYEFLWALMSFSVFVKLLLAVVVDDKLGPIIRMLYSTFIDILRFLGIFAVMLLIFSLSAHMLFYMSPGYHTMLQSFLTLLSAALGSFDFYAFETRETIGAIFMTVWVVIAAIVILNILIALLSSRYEQLAPQADADYVSLMLTYIDGAVFTSKYGGLVVGVPPLNLLTIPFVLLYLLPIPKTKVSYFIVFLSYLPLFLIGIVGFLVFNAIWSVVSYVENFVWIWLNDEEAFGWKLKNSALWVVFGGFYLTYLSAASLPVFVRYLLLCESPNPDKAFNPSDLKAVLHILKRYAKANPSLVYLTWEEAGNLVRDANVSLVEEQLVISHCLIPNLKKSKYSSKASDCERKYAYLFILRKFISPSKENLNLAYTIKTLETNSFEEIETFSMHESLKVGAKLHKEKLEKLLVAI